MAERFADRDATLFAAATRVPATALALAVGGDRVGEPPFDWDRFVERALARELSLVASRAVAALASLGVKIPPEVPRRLTSEPPSVAEHLADRAMRAVPTHLSATVVGWDRYRRFRAHAPPGLRPSGPLDWLADAWQVSGPAGLLAEGGRRLLALDRSLRDRGNW